EYDEQDRLIRKVEASCSNPGKGYDDVTEYLYAYDEDDNLISETSKIKRGMEPLQAKVTTITLTKDADGRLSGWSVTDSTPVNIKYFPDGRVLFYAESATEEYLNGTLVIPSEAYLNNLLTASHLRINTNGFDYPTDMDYLYYSETNAEYEFLYGISKQMPLPLKDGYYTCFRGEMSKDILNRDTWYASTEEYIKDNLWYYMFLVFNKDGQLTGEYSTEGGNGYTREYRYDDAKRLIHTYHFSFDETTTNDYTYDKNNRLTERVETYDLSDTGSGEVHTRTTYRYTYDANGKLTGMTADKQLINDGSSENACTTTLALYKGIEYGDVSQYLDMTAGEVISKIDRDYVYSYHGEDKDLVLGHNGGFYFDSAVQFMCDQCTETMDPSMKTLIVYVDNSVSGNLKVGLGNGLDNTMSYKEIKAILGDALQGETEYDENEFSCYYGVAVYGDFRYIFWWAENPATTNTVPDGIHISKSGLNWVAR
ncbi:MAG: hypothetical protein IKZ69_00535, partial [Lachnospiraceae bacterium]|nr:hypothetical protein [Lachnospiraceae bacterium]